MMNNITNERSRTTHVYCVAYIHVQNVKVVNFGDDELESTAGQWPVINELSYMQQESYRFKYLNHNWSMA